MLTTLLDLLQSRPGAVGTAVLVLVAAVVWLCGPPPGHYWKVLEPSDD